MSKELWGLIFIDFKFQRKKQQQQGGGNRIQNSEFMNKSFLTL